MWTKRNWGPTQVGSGKFFSPYPSRPLMRQERLLSVGTDGGGYINLLCTNKDDLSLLSLSCLVLHGSEGSARARTLGVHLCSTYGCSVGLWLVGWCVVLLMRYLGIVWGPGYPREGCIPHRAAQLPGVVQLTSVPHVRKFPLSKV